MAGAMAAGLKAQLDAQMEAARQQELVRIRQLDTSPVPTMVGSAVATIVWDRAATSIPNMSPTRTVRICRCVSSGITCSPGAPGTPAPAEDDVLIAGHGRLGRRPLRVHELLRPRGGTELFERREHLVAGRLRQRSPGICYKHWLHLLATAVRGGGVALERATPGRAAATAATSTITTTGIHLTKAHH